MAERDRRALSHGALAEIRAGASQQVIVGGESPEVVIRALGFHRSVIYPWPGRFRKGGMAALEAQPVPGRPSKLGPLQLRKLSAIIVGKCPVQLGFQYKLWTRAMIQELIWREFQVSRSESAVGRLLRRLAFTPPRTARSGPPTGPGGGRALVAAGVPGAGEVGPPGAGGDLLPRGVRDPLRLPQRHYLGAPRQTPVVGTTGAHFSLNLLSAVSAQGQLRLMVITGWVNGAVFLEFLQRLTLNQERPVLVITDNHPAHRSQSVARYLDSTQGRLQLFFLPSYSPELSPDELVWRHVKHHTVGRQSIIGPDQFRKLVLSTLHQLQRLPHLNRGLFYERSV